jgi:hypothetical protein
MPGCRASSFDRTSELKIGERKMPAADRNEKNPAIKTEAAEAMAKYGITRVPVDYFHYKEFRYTNLDDAIAQATRENGAGVSAGEGRPGRPSIR